MKLLAKYNRFNLAVTVVVFVIAAVIYYFTISAILSKQVDKALLVEEKEIFDYVKLNSKLPQVFKSNHQQISFSAIAAPVKRGLIDTTFADQKENELEPARALISNVMVNGKQWKILVILSRVETEDLIEVIFLITIALIVLLVVALLLLNRIILARIWKPFYNILEQLKAFNLTDDKAFKKVSSDIDEFAELDTAANTMAQRVKHDYQNLKEFTENASHELMTPVSIINSKLDNLLQTDEFTEKQSKLLDDIYGTVARLTRLNKSMLLLAKIENGLINDDQEVDIADVLSECLYQYEETIYARQITLQLDLHPKQLRVSKILIEVLWNNLLSNAIRHNYNQGVITLTLTDRQLSISNSGTKSIELNQVLKRFQKSNESVGIGLGLTICKQICNTYGFKLQYAYQRELHTFTVVF